MNEFELEETIDKITNEPRYNLSDSKGNIVYGLNYSQAFTIARWLIDSQKSDSQISEKIFTFGCIAIVIEFGLIVALLIYLLMIV